LLKTQDSTDEFGLRLGYFRYLKDVYTLYGQ